jgi:tetratricopeptide (TPR) repeat protein
MINMNGTKVRDETRALVPITLFKTRFSILDYVRDKGIAKQHIEKASLALRKDTDEAIAELDKALKLDKDNPEIFTLMGKALMKKNMLEEALACFTKAIEMDPNNTDAYSIRGMLRHALGDKQGLHEDFGTYSFLTNGKAKGKS